MVPGYGKYETKKNHQKLKIKKLVVVASNVWYNTFTYQLDIMSPGSSVGFFNGWGDILGYNLVQQYGDLLSDCENSVGWSPSDDIFTRRKECLINKCNTVFSGKNNVKEGCLLFANLMEVAWNLLHDFKKLNVHKY